MFSIRHLPTWDATFSLDWLKHTEIAMIPESPYGMRNVASFAAHTDPPAAGAEVPTEQSDSGPGCLSSRPLAIYGQGEYEAYEWPWAVAPRPNPLPWIRPVCAMLAGLFLGWLIWGGK